MKELLVALGVKDRTAEYFAKDIDYALYRYQMKDPDEIAIFLANAVIESAFLTKGREDMFYTTTKALLAVYPSYFKTVKPEEYLRNPKKLGNYVYNGRNGNRLGTEDGYYFRGGGIFGLTGRGQYTAANKIFNGKFDIVANSDDIVKPRPAALTATWYFRFNGLDKTLRQGKEKGPEWVCNRINRGRFDRPAHQLKERLQLYLTVLPLMHDYVNHYDQIKNAGTE